MSKSNTVLPIVSAMAISGITVKRMRYCRAEATPGPLAAVENAYLITVQLHDAASVKIWRNAEEVHEGSFDPGAIAIMDLRAEWSRQYLTGYDFMAFHIPFDVLARASKSLGFAGLAELDCRLGTADTVMMSLSMSLLPALDRPAAANKSYLRQVQNAVVSHLLHSYAPTDRPSHARGLLSPRQEELAKDFMRANFHRSISLEETAAACGLSRSHFIRAFRQTTGVTPHRWLLDYRIEQVKILLASAMTIADIASASGFSDQSHMSRVFQKSVGTTPTVWRRQVRGLR